jgi:hypothetical protein
LSSFSPWCGFWHPLVAARQGDGRLCSLGDVATEFPMALDVNRCGCGHVVKTLRVLSALQKTRGILMFCMKKGLRVLSALRKTRGILMFCMKKEPRVLSAL